MATSLYLLVILLPSTLGQCTVERSKPHFSRSVNSFSLDLIKRLAEDTDNHFVTSPLSLWTLLSSVSLGAEGETLEELQRVLHLPNKKCFSNRYFEIVRGITKANDGSTLERSSTLFVDQQMSLRREFQQKLESRGLSDVMILPFVNFDTVASTINNYVSAATHHTIQDIVSPADLEGVFLILIDAIYFKGRWTLPFQPSQTQPFAFHDEKGNVVGDVNMMSAMHSLNYSSMDQIQAKVLELPYGNGDRFSMLLFLPHTDSTVSMVVNLLKRVSLKSIFKVISQYDTETVQVALPRFKISSELDNLKELLIDMGLVTVFDSNAAQLTLISDFNLHVSDVVQKADVEVTEEGTVASAASEGELSGRSLPDQFFADKPFLFMIVDKSTYIPLFSGAYSKPTIY